MHTTPIVKILSYIIDILVTTPSLSDHIGYILYVDNYDNICINVLCEDGYSKSADMSSWLIDMLMDYTYMPIFITPTGYREGGTDMISYMEEGDIQGLLIKRIDECNKIIVAADHNNISNITLYNTSSP